MSFDRLNHRSHDERGQTSLLIIGFFVMVLLLVGVVVDASAAYLRRQGLDNLADGAALAAADGVKAEQVYAGGLDGEPGIDPEVARRYAEDYLAQVAARRRYEGLSVAVTVDGGSVVVRLGAPLDLPIAPPDWQDQPVITGIAAAYVVVGD